MPGFRKTLKKWLGDSYDRLGHVLVASFAWFTLLIGGIGIIAKLGVNTSALAVAGMLVGFYVLIVAPMTSGVFILARNIVTKDDPSVPDMLGGFRELLRESWSLGFLQVVITLMIIGNAWFYLSRPNMVVKTIGVLVLYLMILWMFSAIYHFPLLLEQRPGAGKIIKRGFLIALDNLGFTAGVFFAIILLTCLLSLTLVGMPLLLVGMVSILQIRALRAAFVKYEILEPEKEYVPGEDTPLRIE